MEDGWNFSSKMVKTMLKQVENGQKWFGAVSSVQEKFHSKLVLEAVSLRNARAPSERV